MPIQQEVSAIQSLLDQPRKVVIVTHQNADGDALGSSLGMYHYLKMKGHQPRVVTPTGYAEFLHWMPGNDTVVVHPRQEQEATKLVAEADLIFCLDFNALHRIGKLGDLVSASKAKKVVIDHHQQPDEFPDIIISDTEASSTAELVYRFIDLSGDVVMVNKDIADNLYVGILTDTGAFQYSNTTPEVHRIVAHLVAMGADIDNAYQQVYNSFSENRLRLFGYCLTEKLTIYPEYHTAMISLNRDELLKFDVKTGDTEGLVNFPLKVSDVWFSALLVDRTELIKMSFRSKGYIDVNKFARANFNGGGHVRAAGGGSYDTLAETIRKFELALPKYKAELSE